MKEEHRMREQRLLSSEKYTVVQWTFLHPTDKLSFYQQMALNDGPNDVNTLEDNAPKGVPEASDNGDENDDDEITSDVSPEHVEEEDGTATIVRERGRLDMRSRRKDILKTLEYNILKRRNGNEMQSWKSYPGMSKIIEIARDIFENNNKEKVDILANMMEVHECQQSAAIVSTIALLVGSKIGREVDKEIREKIGDIILWDVPLIKDKNDWPKRNKYSTKMYMKMKM